MEVEETAEWGTVVRFEIPDSDGLLAELLYSRDTQQLEEVRVGAERYRIEYDSDDEIIDIVLENAGGRRGLRFQSEAQKDYQLPAWMGPSTVEGAMISRISCPRCKGLVTGVCAVQQLMCGKKALKKFLTTGSVVALIAGVSITVLQRVVPALAFTCKAVEFICDADTALGLIYDDSLCESLFCCDRSRCSISSCYDEDTEKCCRDGSVINPGSCCEEEKVENCCGRTRCGSDLNSDLNPFCYDMGIQKCCKGDGTYSTEILGPDDCCLNEVRCVVQPENCFHRGGRRLTSHRGQFPRS